MMARAGKRKLDDGDEAIPVRTSPRKSSRQKTARGSAKTAKRDVRVENGGQESEGDGEGDGDEDDEDNDDKDIKQTRKRKTTTSTNKKSASPSAEPMASRTPGLKMFVGAHTSVAKGVENAITNSVAIGANAFACFLKSQRKWENPPLRAENREAFKRGLIAHQYDGNKHVVPHGSYLVNLASADADMADKSYRAFVDDLGRCEALGIRHYNFHPGSAGGGDVAAAIERLAAQLNRALAETSTVVALLENMATRGSIIGGRFEDLRDIIRLIRPELRHRVGVCIDTCHAFAAGYDLRTAAAFQQTLADFDAIVGLQYVRALHLNDSKAPLASHRDLHQNIGLGFLGLRAFHSVMNEPRFHGLPMILETPCERPDPKNARRQIPDRRIWAAEIKLLESLIGMDADGAEFRALERELSDRGAAERAQMQKQFDDKQAKEAKKLAKGADTAKAQKSLKDMLKGAKS